MEIRIVRETADVNACFPVLSQLRPQLVAESFAADVARMARGGFELAALFDPTVRAVAGFREMEMFATGRVLYVDDLVTDAALRSRGYGKAMIAWLVAESARRGCRFLELDSGTSRVDAHRFYRAHGLESVALHFSLATPSGSLDPG